MKNWSLTTTTSIAIAITVALLVHIGTISLRQCFQRMEASYRATEIFNIVVLLSELLTNLARAEAGEHNYVTTGDEQFLNQYRRNFERIRVSLSQLRISMERNPAYDQMMGKLLRAIEERNRIGDDVVKIRTERGQEEALRTLTLSEEDALTKEIEVQVHDLKQSVDLEVETRDRELDRAGFDTIVGISILMTVALTILVLILIVINRYVTERRQAERTISEAERRFRAVFNQTFQFTGLLSPEGTVLESSRTALDFAGINADTVIGKPFWETPWWSHSAETQERLKAAIAQAAQGNLVRFEDQQMGSTGPVTVDFSLKPIKDEDGNVVMLIPEARDISVRIDFERALAEREARMRAIVETAPDGIVTITSDGTIESINPAMERMFGYPEEEMIGAHIHKVLPRLLLGEDGQAVGPVEISERKILGLVGRDLFGYRKNNSVFPVEVALVASNIGSRQIVTGIVRDITERREAEKRVSDFYSTVSHELRTPLTSIRTALGLMEGPLSAQLTDKILSIVNVARTESERLIRLINDILDFKKIEAGKLMLRPALIDPTELIEIAVTGVRGIAEQASIEIEIDSQEHSDIYCDHDRIVGALTNLLSNAIKFSPPNSTVYVSLKKVNEKFRFSVKDNGQGIPEDQLPRLFGKFEQLSSEAREKGGTGLGLAITKAIVEQHGGKIGVESVFGEGCTFWFELPVAITEGEGTIEEEDTPTLRQSVLVVEDDDHICERLKHVVSLGGYDYNRASTLVEAEQLISQYTPDAIMLELQLPDGNGVQLLSKLREMKGAQNVPVLALTGFSADMHTLGCPLMIDWIAEPIVNGRLQAAVKLSLSHATDFKDRLALVVHSSKKSKKTLVDELSKLGMDCTVASTASEAKQIIIEDEPDVIVLDLGLPDSDCFDLLHLLRHGKAQIIPLILYSTQATPKEEIDRFASAFMQPDESQMNEPEFMDVAKELLEEVLAAKRSGRAQAS